MPLIPSLSRENRNLGDPVEKLGMKDQASLNKPSRLASMASGQPLGMNYIPPLDLPTGMGLSLGGGSPSAPTPLQPGAVENRQGIKRRPITGQATLTGQ